MNFLTSWLLSVVGTAFLVAIADGLMPEKRIQEVGRLIGGMLILLTLLSPLLKIHMNDLSFSMDDYLGKVDQKIADYHENQTENFSMGIKESTESYIKTVAQKMDLDITADVEIKMTENGVPTLYKIRMNSPYHAELAKRIEDDLGLSPEYQEWDTE